MALLRPSELARYWELHPKTVVLWIREGKLPALRTPGAQYRVRSEDARAYCDKHDLPPLPRAVTSPRGVVAAAGRPGAAHKAIARACRAEGASFLSFPSVLEGLIGAAADRPDVLAIDGRTDEVKLVDVVRALRRSPGVQDIAVVIYEADPSRAGPLIKLGVASVVARGKADEAALAVLDVLSASRTRS